jgi:hypothetical protein
MKKWFLVGLLLSLALVACGGGSGDDQPVAVVKEVVGAMETLDFEQASEFFCAEQKDELASTMESGFAELEQMGMDPDELLSAITLNLEDMEYEEKSQDGDKAVVHMSGNMALEFDTEKLRSFLQQALEASGQQVTDQEMDFVIGLFESMAGQEAPIDADVDVVREDGEWVVCDDLSFLDSADMFELPLP